MKAVTLDTSVKGLVPPRRKKKDARYKYQFELHIKARDILHKITTYRDCCCNLTYYKQFRNFSSSSSVSFISILTKYFMITTYLKMPYNIFLTVARRTRTTLLTDDETLYKIANRYDIKTILLREY